jgi:cbb3-type cytochrome oxidase subunit 3
MYTQILSKFDQPWLPITALIIFGVCFCAYTFWTFKKENKPVYENTSLMPLDDGVKHE